ncbi:MmgE/PrpD family protein [Planomicrobium sp. YIM 101495]|uniref:MmgE/PrpD family protein n=1 Tax=Planomicrobium sp. YIM 101495 TaxID=2665160 RepID=UPI0018AC6D5D|nr:MmgE/PrpD family protein [Planomicrobium sp. YIM 101495]
MNKISDYITNFEYESISEKMFQLSKMAIIDTVGSAIAGFNEPAVLKVETVFSKSIKDGEGASVWRGGNKVRLEHAALINGVATHALDYDDVAPSILAHPSAPLTAVILPFAEEYGKSGKEVIAAFVIGTEVMTKIGKLMGFRHYDQGWHATSTLGAIGGAAACAYLAELSEEKTKNAIAISASMSSGLQKNFGTMTKPLHVGLAAQNSVQAVLLAIEGFEANHKIFEERGFFQAFTGEMHDETLNQKIKEVKFGGLHDFEENGLSVKKFACCYFMHRFTAGVLELRNENSLTIDDVEEIQITVPPGGYTALIHSNPQTGLQGKFSAEYACLAALEDGVIQLQTFTDEEVQRTVIQQNLHRVIRKEGKGKMVDARELENLPVHVRITTRQGKSVEKEIFHAPGSKEKPMTIEEYKDKWHDCLNYSASEPLSTEQKRFSEYLFEQAVNLEEFADIGAWIIGLSQLFEQIEEKISL